jgi:O-acetyl-ADP-ribose deacetylase (regulator of RNase III)
VLIQRHRFGDAALVRRSFSSWCGLIRPSVKHRDACIVRNDVISIRGVSGLEGLFASSVQPEMTYQVGDSRLRIIRGDITRSSAEVLVSSDDHLLSMGGGVSHAIDKAAGPVLRQDASKMGHLELGDVVVTSAGNLDARYVFHAITIGPADAVSDLPPGALVRQITQEVMRLLSVLGCSSVAFPAIGAGAAGIRYDVVAAQMGAALLDAILGRSEPVEVDLYVKNRGGDDEGAVGAFLESFEMAALEKFGLKAFDDSAGPRVRNLTPHLKQGLTHHSTDDDRRNQIFGLLRKLDIRRNEAESQVFEQISLDTPDSIAEMEHLRLQLEQIQALRTFYEQELSRQELPGAGDGNTVFVSSTSRDLGDHRAAVRSVIERMNLRFIGMEDFVAEPTSPAEMIRRRVLESRIYLGILGMRYGHIDPISGLSMTELEYRQAIASDKDIRMFVMDEGAPITAGMVELDPASLAKLNEFKESVLKNHSCALFRTRDDLAEKVERTLRG